MRAIDLFHFSKSIKKIKAIEIAEAFTIKLAFV